MPRMGVLGLLATLALAPPAAAAPGDLLDTWQGTEQGLTIDANSAVAVDSQGRVLVAASHDTDPATNDFSTDVHTDVIRLLPPTMDPDPAFNGGNPVHLDIVTGSNASEYAIGIGEGPGGTIWVGARRQDLDILLARLEADGDYDNTVSGDGRLSRLLPGTSASWPHDMDVDDSGRPVFGGRGMYGGDTRAYLARFTTAGVLDSGFGGDGEVAFDTALGNGETFGLDALPGGAVVGAGTDGGATAIAMKVDAAGVPDPAFDTDGYATTTLASDNLSSAYGATADAAGRVIILGQATLSGGGGARFAVQRFTAAGAPDGTFGTGVPATGVVWLPAFARRGTDVAVTCDGRLVVSGNGGDPMDPGRNSFVIGRLTSAGALDSAFAPAATPAGVAWTVFGKYSNGYRVAVGDGFLAQVGVRWADAPGIDFKPVVAKWDNAPCGTAVAPVDEEPDDDPPPAGGGGGGGGTPVTGDTSPPTPVVSLPPAPRPAAPAATIANSVTFPSTRRCASRRNFSIRLRVPAGAAVRSAEVLVNGRRAAIRRGSRLRSRVDLRTLPRGRFTVTIRLTLANGRKVSGTRRYRTCAPKRRGGKRPRV